MSNIKSINGKKKPEFSCLITTFEGDCYQYNNLNDYTFDGLNLMLFPSDIADDIPIAIVNVSATMSVNFQKEPFPESEEE